MPPKAKKCMHLRNVFRKPPDYTELAIKYKEFRQVCKLELAGYVSIDYRNESALRALTRTLLQEYFGLDVEFAPGSLIPTVPLRLNYILWVEDLLAGLNATEAVKGIDIGCGSSCIYSLLAAKKNSWQMFALESSTTNAHYARENIARNGLEAKVSVFEQENKELIFSDFFDSIDEGTTFQFCLCNPPFYDSSLSDPFHTSTRNPEKRAPPPNCHTGQAEELTCVGGEVNFVHRIIGESVKFKERVLVFTSMLGHKSSLQRVEELLEQAHISNRCSTEFYQGKTTRWGVAWSFATTSPSLVDLRAI